METTQDDNHGGKNNKRKKQQSNVINKPYVHINKLKATFVKVQHEHDQIRNRIRRFKYDMEQTLLEVQTINEAMINKLLSTFTETMDQKRTSFLIDERINFVDIEKDFLSINERFKGLEGDVDCLRTLSVLKEKVFTKYVGKGGYNGCCIPMFLHELYKMVEKEEINDLISWSLPSCESFVISDINKFATHVLPMYFKHANFASFNSQLNAYGFKKISWERHEYANEWFRGGRYDLLANITRRNKDVRRLKEFGITFSTPEVEMFDNWLETIQHDQKNKIIQLSNYEEKIKSSIDELKKTINNMANVIEKMIEKSSEKHENNKKAKLESETNVTGNGNKQELEVDELEIALTENKNTEAQYFIQESWNDELGFDPEELKEIVREWEAHALNVHVHTMAG